ncbi:MAG TPA: glycerol-3-phosphate 1-O-acyltransferase PlsY [Planctomycetaceae bacterium]|nr:glycerol-3-phosphate 1-O-acyltransferase PlsY [Planctomycetaceae bacterium]
MPALAVLLAYLIGSLPFGFIVAWLISKEDIRTKGSGNIGATNVARVLGAKWGILVLVLDAFKGLLPVWGLPRLAYETQDPNFLHLQVACGVATIVGHMFPCYLKFQGGKGVATSLGVILILSPWATLAAFGVFVVSILVWRIVSLSSMLAAVTFGAVSLWTLRPNPFAPDTWTLAAFSLLIPALILLRHRTNIKRLLKGEELKFQSKRKQEPPSEVPTAN